VIKLPRTSRDSSAKLLGVKFAVPVLISIALLSITACGGQRSTGCVPALGLGLGGRLIADGAKMTVRAGTIVYVALVEADKYLSLGDPRGFPWLSVTSSNPHVLARTPLCAQAATYTLPVSVAAFRATHAGEATLTARLTPPWRSFKTGPRPYQSTVTIRD